MAYPAGSSRQNRSDRLECIGQYKIRACLFSTDSQTFHETATTYLSHTVNYIYMGWWSGTWYMFPHTELLIMLQYLINYRRATGYRSLPGLLLKAYTLTLN